MIKLIGTGEQPEVLLSNGGEMYLRPTCIATSISRGYQLQNVGRLPLKFKWSLSHDSKKYLNVEPQSGVIHSNEIQVSFLVLYAHFFFVFSLFIIILRLNLVCEV